MGLELISFTWKGRAKRPKKNVNKITPTKLTSNINRIQFKDFFCP